MAALRYAPEEVDGKPVAITLAFPVTFSVGPEIGIKRLREELREEVRRSPECVAVVGQGEEPDRPVALDSPFKPLKTG